ncbi:uncharacterized protein BDR25DRAFT_356194 [Lindgomyces ingoldianus]|uniref:Uncharacterized protein n=1 Tax=Lindgomyces ingoldianus TaxID=673940 RepID=A0ACB6QUQ7_9PLEO|nr:uncharacterized protein BDR25DRAFT_356194 [Lindgomyces ingoldianus]KAF2469926.1 hypothetical protein BDR25DRAFT_356194 [Lindgomyces ingoldianus]
MAVKRVDIEYVQRHPLYWGSNAQVWDPTRFLDENNKIKTSLLQPAAAWMPFVVGSLKCPSANGYSAQLVVVIISEILNQILPGQDGKDGLYWRLQGPEWDPATSAEPLRPGREEYGTVKAVVDYLVDNLLDCRTFLSSLNYSPFPSCFQFT